MTNTTNTANATTASATRTGATLAQVMTDMLLEGRTAELAALQQAEAGLGFESALAALVARIQANTNHYYATKFPTLAPPVISYDKSRRGQRFVRIIATDNWNHEPGRRVVGFVEVATGLLWKAATFKAPAMNHHRGSMYHLPASWSVGASAGASI